MFLHPELRALRDDDSPQRTAQAELHKVAAEWKARPQQAAVIAAMTDYAAGQELEKCAALHALFDPDCSQAARDLVAGFIGSHVTALAALPLGHPAMRHFTDGTVSTLLLARVEAVTLTLVAMDGRMLARQPRPTSVAFAAIESTERILAGSAHAELVSRRPPGSRGGALIRRNMHLKTDAVVHRQGARDVLMVDQVSQCLVTLRLQRRAPGDTTTVEVDLANGQEVQRAAGSPDDSRIELAMALLGRMERQDAVPHLTRIIAGDASPSLRWQALRECLALDTATGFAALNRLSASPGDPLANAARNLHQTLLQAHPSLAVPRSQPCHA